MCKIVLNVLIFIFLRFSVSKAENIISCKCKLSPLRSCIKQVNVEKQDTIDNLTCTRSMTSRVTFSKSPGASGGPSPCGEEILLVDLNRISNDEVPPLIFHKCPEYEMEYLRRFRWEVYNPRFNWFYDPKIRIGEESPCQVFKEQFNGIDVTILAPDSIEPVCTTIKNENILKEIRGFNVMNANSCCHGLKAENYATSCKRIFYALNLVSGCGKMRTVVLSKNRDEFPIGYNFNLIRNPCRRSFVINKNN